MKYKSPVEKGLTFILILFLNFHQLHAVKKKKSKTVHLNKRLDLLILTERYINCHLEFRVKLKSPNPETKFDQTLHCVLATGSGDLFLRMDLGALGQDLRLICGLSGLFLLSSIVAFYIWEVTSHSIPFSFVDHILVV